MSDKIAAIRREVEERALDVEKRCCSLALKATEGVVIYGVPLNEGEIGLLRSLIYGIRSEVTGSTKDGFEAIWAMFERGKK